MATNLVVIVAGVLAMALAGPLDDGPVWTAPLSNGLCGPQHGYAACGSDQCCSNLGWCGSTSAHCNSESLWIGPERRAQLPNLAPAPLLRRVFYGISLPSHPQLEGDAPLPSAGKVVPSSTPVQEAVQNPDSSKQVQPSTPEAGKGPASSNEVQPSISSPEAAQNPESGNSVVRHFENLAVSTPFVPALNWCGHHPVVALTFDDGPISGSEYTATVLDELARLGIKGTFFLSPGAPSATNHRDRSGQCNLLKRMLNEGHTVAGHTMTHEDLMTLSNQEIKKQIDDYNNWYQNCIGSEPYFQAVRPPYGNLRADQRAFINTLGVMVVSWNADSNDWRGGSTQQIFAKTIGDFEQLDRDNRRITPNQPSSVIVLHHDFWHTPGHGRGVLPRYVDYFRSRGYRFVNLEKCVALCSSTNDCQMPSDWPGVYGA